MDRIAGLVVRALLLAAWVALSGCADGGGIKGFGSAPASNSKIVPTGDVPASKSMTDKYGITHWRMFSGVNHTVVTGFKADGTPVRGVDIAWFKQASDGTPGHLRLTMLDGSGAIVRRYVGGKATGQLNADQMEVVITQQVDFYEHFLSLTPSKQKKAKPKTRAKLLAGGGGSLHLQDDGSGVSSSAPNTGPQCSAALAGGNTDGASCVLDLSGAMVSSETILGAMAGLMQGAYDCGSWAIQNNNVQSTCETENTTHCTVASDGGWENCDYSSEMPDPSQTGTPQGPGLSQQDLCANYPNSAACSSLAKTNSFCSASTDCVPGDECNQGFCSTAGYTGVPGDDCTNSDAVKYGGSQCSSSSAPTDQEVGSASNSNCLSCAPGSSDVTSNPQNGDVSPSGGGDSSGSSSGGGSTGTASGSSSGGGSGDDPGGSLGGGAPSCAGQSGDCSGGGACCSPLVCDPGTNTCVTTDQMMGSTCTAYYGDACSSDSDCCLGSCDPSSSTCSSGSSSGGSSGSSSGGDSSGSSSGGSSSGSSSGGSCASDGSACAADSDCCGGTCDTSSGTCGSASGSSSGGSSSGSSSGGSCAADGNSCASASDCCSQVCGSCDGLCGGMSAGASGSPCASDSDCCNGCDTANGVCL